MLHHAQMSPGLANATRRPLVLLATIRARMQDYCRKITIEQAVNGAKLVGDGEKAKSTKCMALLDEFWLRYCLFSK